MCATARSVLVTCRRWQVAQTCVSVVFTSWCSSDFGRVDAVARRARDVPGGVRAGLPAGMRSAVVAGEARLADVRRLHRAKLQDVPLGVVVNVRLPGAVAALAPVGRRRRPRILRLPVFRALEAGLLIGVANDAGIAPDIASRRSRRLRGGRRLGLRWSGLRRRRRRSESSRQRPSPRATRPPRPTAAWLPQSMALNRAHCVDDCPHVSRLNRTRSVLSRSVAFDMPVRRRASFRPEVLSRQARDGVTTADAARHPGESPKCRSPRSSRRRDHSNRAPTAIAKSSALQLLPERTVARRGSPFAARLLPRGAARPQSHGGNPWMNR